MKKEILKRLIKKAREASKKSYSPYSKFSVGASVLTEENKIFAGCNIENSSYGLSICAERVAIFKAVSEGYFRFKAIAVYCNTSKFTFPCGACLQVLSEFSKNIKIISINKEGKYKIKNLKELLPEMFYFF
jgi:cytidine deaminase